MAVCLPFLLPLSLSLGSPAFATGPSGSTSVSNCGCREGWFDATASGVCSPVSIVPGSLASATLQTVNNVLELSSLNGGDIASFTIRGTSNLGAIKVFYGNNNAPTKYKCAPLGVSPTADPIVLKMDCVTMAGRDVNMGTIDQSVAFRS